MKQALNSGVDNCRNQFIDVKWINHCEVTDLYCHYRSSTPDPASLMTFRRCWKEWKPFLRIRTQHQLTRCEICAEKSKERKLAKTIAEKENLLEQYEDHINTIMGCRRVESRGNYYSEHSRKLLMGDSSGVDCTVKFTIDGIDEYKFSCPRNLQNSKAFEPLWRPKLHCIGLLVHGWVEYFAICDPDMLKNANLTLTVLSRGLDILWDDCRKHGLPLPQNFVRQGDKGRQQPADRICGHPFTLLEEVM